MKKQGELLFIVMMSILSACKGELAPIRDIMLGNTSSIDVSDTRIYNNVAQKSFTFGYLSKNGNEDSGKFIMGFPVSYTHPLGISWREDGVAKSVELDLGKYHQYRERITGLIILYRGDGVWEVIAEEGSVRERRRLEVR